MPRRHAGVECDPARYREIRPEIGRGSNGTVALGSYLGTRVAVKNIKMDDAFNNDELRRECSILSHLHHPNIVTMIGMLGHAVVLEYCAGGTLFEKVHSTKKAGKLEMDHKTWVLEQVLNALVYLNSKDIVHGDLKSANVFFLQEFHPSQQQPVVKVGDFGMARSRRRRCGARACRARKA